MIIVLGVAAVVFITLLLLCSNNTNADSFGGQGGSGRSGRCEPDGSRYSNIVFTVRTDTAETVDDEVEIAKLLDVSAEYLVTGIEIEGQINPENLNNNERKLINLYRKLNQNDQENTQLAINAWAGKSGY